MTYGRVARNKSQRSTSDCFAPLPLQETPAAQRSTSTTATAPLSSGLLNDEAGNTGSVERKRRRLVSDDEKDHTHESDLGTDARTAVTSVGDTREVASGVARPSDHSVATKSGSPRGQNEKQDSTHLSSHLALPSHPEMTKRCGKTAHPRQKLVNLLGSSAEESPIVDTDVGERSHAARPLDHTSIRGRGPLQQPKLDPDATSHYDTNGGIENPVTSPPNLRGSKVTYARQRSFLNEVNLSDTPGDQDTILHPPRPQIAPKVTAHTDLHFDSDTDDSTGPIRSIHELRQAGDNARFRGAIECILDDITDGRNSISTRCNGFFQLCSKLLDRQSARRFAEYGFAESLVECVTNDLDTVSASFALCSYVLIHSSGAFPHAPLASFWSKLLDISPRLLDTKDDILLLSEQRRFEVSKTVQRSIQETMPILSSVIRGNQPPSTLTPHYLALRCIQSVLWSFQQHKIIKTIPNTILDCLIDLLQTERPPGSTDQPLSPECFQIVYSIFSILEIYTILLGSLPIDPQNALQPLARLYQFLDLGQSGSYDSSQQIRVLYIRVILNLTNKEPSFCNNFVTPKLVGSLIGITIAELGILPGGCVPERSLSTVILALGTLINLTEKSDSTRIFFLATTHNSASYLRLLLEKFSANIGAVSEV